MKISIIIPVYNEEKTIAQILQKIFEIKLENWEKEVIVVNDGSLDNTEKILLDLQKKYNFILLDSSPEKKNIGKGGAIHKGLEVINGDVVIIQDADLEYNPLDYSFLLKPFLNNKIKVVYGSRYLEKKSQRFKSIFYWGSKLLTLIFNILYQTNLTDLNTGYKVFRKEVIKQINLKEKDFAFCEEITAKIIKKGYSILEIPISYHPRSIKEGKKIRLKDWFRGFWVILKYRF